jgi:outer membrane protein TolC
MRPAAPRRVRLWAVAMTCLGLCCARAQPAGDKAYPIDLPTALRLAGARNLDVKIARERLNEAQANRQSAVELFLPSIGPGLGYHRRDGVAQASPSGIISAAHYDSFSPGVGLAAQVTLGDAIFNSLAAKQLANASEQGLESQRQDAVRNAAVGYFDLAREAALVDVVKEALKTSQEYQRELHEAVASGIAFKGDELRVQTQTQHYQLALQQAQAQQRLAAVNLALVLHLDSKVELVPRDADMVPVALFDPNTSADALVERAMGARPELKQSQALLSASRAARNGALYGPLIPSIGLQAFGGDLSGGPDRGPHNSGSVEDYVVGLSWRLGPGGLLDFGRMNASKARLSAAQLGDTQLRDVITSQVVADLTQVRSTQVQIGLAQANLSTADESLRLARSRKQFGVGVVLEDIEAQQALYQARSDYVTALTGFNKAQYGLNHAVGGLLGDTGPPP